MDKIALYSHAFEDPLKTFFETLFQDFDIDEASWKINAVQVSCVNDFFLNDLTSQIIDGCRWAVTEVKILTHEITEKDVYLSNFEKLSDWNENDNVLDYCFWIDEFYSLYTTT